MSFLGSIITLLDARMTEPAMFGWFHLLFIALTILCAVFLCKKFKNPSKKTVSKILLSFALISIFLEIYKQFNYTFSYDGNIVTADYQWYAFPFQFCSTPMYVALLAVIIKKEKIHNALCAYLATFSTFAGICVFAYPEQVFIDTIGINIQTMICHGGMIAIGIWLLACGYIKLQHKTIVPASVTFAIMVVLASVMNEIAKLTGLLERESFNMFYISPHCEPSLPVYSLVQQVVPFPLCLVIYIAAFALASYIILFVAMTINKIKNKKQPPQNTECHV